MSEVHKLRSGDTIISDANIPYVILLDVTNEMDFIRDRAYVIGTSSEDIKHLSYHARKMGFDEMVFDSLEKEIDIEERNRDLYINDINLAIDDMREEIMEVDEERLGFESHLKWLEEKEDVPPYSYHLPSYVTGTARVIYDAIQSVRLEISDLDFHHSIMNSELEYLHELKAKAIHDKKLHVGKARVLYRLAKCAFLTFRTCAYLSEKTLQYGLDKITDDDKVKILQVKETLRDKANDMCKEFLSMQCIYRQWYSSDGEVEKIKDYETVINNTSFPTAEEVAKLIYHDEEAIVAALKRWGY